jgi:regulatory protein
MFEEALSQAYRYLNRRERTVAEVRAHLKRKHPAPELIDAVLDELIKKGYLDDARYAKCFTEDRRKLDGWGSERIRRRLLELGIERNLAQQASEPEDQEQEIRAALEVLHRRVRFPPSDPSGRKRALGMLVRRGYAPELAYNAIRRFEAQAREEATLG